MLNCYIILLGASHMHRAHAFSGFQKDPPLFDRFNLLLPDPLTIYQGAKPAWRILPSEKK